MPITCEEKNGRMQLCITGPLTAVEVGAAAKELICAMEGGSPSAIDAGGITDCDTLGVQLLWAALRGAKEGEAGPCLLALSPAVREAAGRAGVSFVSFTPERGGDRCLN